MIKDVYKIDNNGLYVDVYKINTEKNAYYDGIKWSEVDFYYVDVQPPSAKIVKWENNNWTIVEEYPTEPIPPQPPSLEERLQMAEDTILFLLMGGM